GGKSELEHSVVDGESLSSILVGMKRWKIWLVAGRSKAVSMGRDRTPGRPVGTAFLSLALMLPFSVCAQTNYPFQNPDLPIEQRVANAVSLMTLDEKIDLLRFRAGVPRLNIPALGSVEGLHGEAMGGPSNWGQRSPHPTTIFPQAIGMAETWDTDIL